LRRLDGGWQIGYYEPDRRLRRLDVIGADSGL
jgi:hypothetical protein